MLEQAYPPMIVPNLPPKPERETGHQAYTGTTGSFVLEVEALSPIFVGSGEVQVDSRGAYQSFARVTGPEGMDHAVIPGSSLKGVIRSYAEAVSPSCLSGCRRSREGPGPCVACSIFGAMGYSGRVSVLDAPFIDGSLVVEGIEERWAPRASSGGRKFYRHMTSVLGGTERVELACTGALFRGTCIFRNLTDWELGLVLLAMGVATDSRFLLKLGGGKAQGLGSVEMRVSQVDDRVRGRRPQRYVDDCVTAYLDHAQDEWRLGRDIAATVRLFVEDSDAFRREVVHP